MNQPSAMKKGKISGALSPATARSSAPGAASVAERMSHPGKCAATEAASVAISASAGAGSEGWPWATMMAARVMAEA